MVAWLWLILAVLIAGATLASWWWAGRGDRAMTYLAARWNPTTELADEFGDPETRPATVLDALLAEERRCHAQAAADLADPAWWIKEDCPATAQLLALVAAPPPRGQEHTDQPWLDLELPLLHRDDLTVEQMATLLHRPVEQVRRRRQQETTPPIRSTLQVPHPELPTMDADQARAHLRAIDAEVGALFNDRPTPGSRDRLATLTAEVGRTRRRLDQLGRRASSSGAATPGRDGCSPACLPVHDPHTGEILGRVHNGPARTSICPCPADTPPSTSTPCPLRCGESFTWTASTGEALYTPPPSHRVLSSQLVVCPGRGAVQVNQQARTISPVAAVASNDVILAGPGVEYTYIGPDAIETRQLTDWAQGVANAPWPWLPDLDD